MTYTSSNGYYNLEQLESERIILYPLADWEKTDGDMNTWYTIVSREDNLAIGRIGMVHHHPEWKNTQLQIIIQDEEKRREGYGLEALELVEKYIFDTLEYQRIAVRIAAFNKAAVCFFKKAGYKLEGVQELGCFYNDKYYDVILLRLLRSEYVNRKKRNLCSSAESLL